MIEPYYQQDGITLYHGDCRRIVPQLGKFDLLLTDPPYGIGRDGQRRDNTRMAHQFKGWDKRPQSWELQMLIASAHKQIIWGGNYFVESLTPSMGWLVWDKWQRAFTCSDGELAWTNFDSALRILTLHRVGPGSLTEEGGLHPTQKPAKLFRWCIEQAGEVQTILDPFAGSGTTGRVAMDMGLQATLIEQDRDYCEIIKSRLAQRTLIAA